MTLGLNVIVGFIAKLTLSIYDEETSVKHGIGKPYLESNKFSDKF